MRFVEDGPDIPSDLIVAQERGETLFVCGAGVSHTVGLPLFRGLVEGVYRRLDEGWEGHPAEREGMGASGKLAGQYDRVLRCLERRLGASETSHHGNMRTRIRAAVRAELDPPKAADLSNHLALLELSRDSQGRSRLLTTNFDTLFERAWQNEYAQAMASHAGRALPRPMSAGFAGVLHLHGRLADPLVELFETDMVLTSAEFGDAYLRSGWASRYVYDLARAHTLVLVGYQADDPPMRYLLEALEADRDIYPDLRKVYAFGECSADHEALVEALWCAKGIEPILYRVGVKGHEPLYSTLRVWESYAKDPTAWRRERLKNLFAEESLHSSEEHLDRCMELLDRGDANQLLGELSPAAAWLPILVQRGLFKQRLPAVWIASRVDDPEMIRACIALAPLDDPARWNIERALERDGKILTSVRERAWRLLLDVRAPTYNPFSDNGWHNWRPLICRGQTDFQARRVVADILTPRLRLDRSILWPDQDDPSPESLNKLFRVDLQPADHPPASEILRVWPDTLKDSLALFRTLDRSVIDALEQASDLGMTGGWDRPSRSVPSIAEHPQNNNSRGFLPIVHVLADLWQRSVKHDSALARQLIRHWRESPFLLPRRLYIFALANKTWPANAAAQAALSLDDQDFWGNGAQVEVMRLLAGRWAEFGKAERSALESRLCEGIPKTLFSDIAPVAEDEWASIVDRSIYLRLSRIRSAGGVLSENSNALFAEIAACHPRWQPSPGDRDDFSVWHESRVGPDGHPELLAGVDDDRLVQEAFRLQQERQIAEADLWRVFCSADPERALRGLALDGDAERWIPEAWRYLLWAARDKEGSSFQHEVAKLILKMPDARLKEILHAASSWMARRREALEQATGDGTPHFLPLWDRLAKLAYEDQGTDELKSSFEGEPVNESLNHPGGDLAASLLEALASTKPAEDSGLGAVLEPRFLLLVKARNRAGLLGRVYIVRELAYMDAVAPDWTAEHLIPRLDWAHEEALPLWQAYAFGKVGSPRLFNALKPAMLQAFEHMTMPAHYLEGVFQKLFTVSVWHRRGGGREYSLTSAEVKHALAVAPEEVRQSGAWDFWRMMSDERVADKAEHWHSLAKPLIQEIWPLDAQARGKETSERLVLMALECGSAFPDAVETILDFVVPYQLYSLSPELRLDKHHEELFQCYPGAFLKLANALIDPDLFPVPDDLPKFLADCLDLDAALERDTAYIRLYGLRRRQNA